jgi:hypothetical protein
MIEREEKRKMGKRQTETKRKKELNTCKARVFPTCLLIYASGPNV